MVGTAGVCIGGRDAVVWTEDVTEGIPPLVTDPDGARQNHAPDILRIWVR